MDVNFCSQCKNMTYIHTGEDEVLYHVCKVWGHNKPMTETGCIYNTTTEGIDIGEIINTNQYITHDITLPVITDNDNIKCTNDECESILDKKPCKITYVKYDNDNMRYVYICIDCHNNGNETYVW